MRGRSRRRRSTSAPRAEPVPAVDLVRQARVLGGDEHAPGERVDALTACTPESADLQGAERAARAVGVTVAPVRRTRVVGAARLAVGDAGKAAGKPAGAELRPDRGDDGGLALIKPRIYERLAAPGLL